MGQQQQDKRQSLVQMAQNDLQGRLGVSTEVIEVHRVEPAEFRDTSLGVPEPGMMYAQVITPGYVIELEAGGGRYVYHAGGGRVVLASKSGTEANNGACE